MQAFDFFHKSTDVQVYSPGQVIFAEGQSGDFMFVILAGEVQISVQAHPIDWLTTGDIVGEMALIDEGVRSATATAVTPCKLLPVNETRFAELVQEYPAFALRVMIIMSNRLRRLMEVEVQRQRLEEELKIGREIQISLLPKHLPQIPGWEFATFYRAARQVGGDLYDFIPSLQNSQRLNLVIADVTGKGVAAALFMASIRSTIRTISANDRTPGETLRRTNRFIVGDTGSRLFLSAFYAALDTQTGRLVCANGGHDWPLWWQAATQTITPVAIPGMILGAFTDIQPVQRELEIAAGDCLVFYTDGITEARNAKNEMFEEARLAEVVVANARFDAEGVVQAIVTAVTNFISDTPQSDDLTLMVVKRVLNRK